MLAQSGSIKISFQSYCKRRRTRQCRFSSLGLWSFPDFHPLPTQIEQCLINWFGAIGQKYCDCWLHVVSDWSGDHKFRETRVQQIHPLRRLWISLLALQPSQWQGFILGWSLDIFPKIAAEGYQQPNIIVRSSYVSVLPKSKNSREQLSTATRTTKKTRQRGSIIRNSWRVTSHNPQEIMIYHIDLLNHRIMFISSSCSYVIMLIV